MSEMTRSSALSIDLSNLQAIVDVFFFHILSLNRTVFLIDFDFRAIFKFELVPIEFRCEGVNILSNRQVEGYAFVFATKMR